MKMMKIGGKETNIVLNPLNAIRSAATSALRRLLSSDSKVLQVARRRSHAACRALNFIEERP